MAPLKTSSPLVQHLGTWFSGYPWQVFGCGTYRCPITTEGADKTMQTYIARVERSLQHKCRVSYFAVREQKSSGCGYLGARYHWHFLFAVPPSYASALLGNATVIWTEHYGNTKIDEYDAKSIWRVLHRKDGGRRDYGLHVRNLNRLGYSGPLDIVKLLMSDPYVPAQAKRMISGQTLRLIPGAGEERQRRSSLSKKATCLMI